VNQRIYKVRPSVWWSLIALEEKDYREYQRELKHVAGMLQELYASVNIDALKKKAAELQEQTQKEEFWQENFKPLSRAFCAGGGLL